MRLSSALLAAVLLFGGLSATGQSSGQSAGQSSVPAADPRLANIDGIMAELSKITGWPVKHKVQSEVLSRADFAKIMEENAKESEGDKDTHVAELTLKMFGAVPWDFNLARESADLLEEQTAAYYDYKKKRLVVLDSPTKASGEAAEVEDRVALAHELAHALADQQFGLHHYLGGAKDDDAATARQAVVEGQAHWLSWAYEAELETGRAEVPPALLRRLSNIGATGADYPALTNTPLYMRESLLFPYTQGMRFQDAAYRKLGREAFTHVFQDAPLSTQEILHPEEYDDGIVPTHPMLPELKPVLGKDAKQWKQLVVGDVGEFDYSAILRQYGSQDNGRQIASHWRGGAYALYEDKKTKAPMLVHSSDWDSPEAARAFFRAYRGVLQSKWKQFAVDRETDAEVTGSGDRGGFLLRISGSLRRMYRRAPFDRKKRALTRMLKNFGTGRSAAREQG